jgi:hypothetical protein
VFPGYWNIVAFLEFSGVMAADWVNARGRVVRRVRREMRGMVWEVAASEDM